MKQRWEKGYGKKRVANKHVIQDKKEQQEMDSLIKPIVFGFLDYARNLALFLTGIFLFCKVIDSGPLAEYPWNYMWVPAIIYLSTVLIIVLLCFLIVRLITLYEYCVKEEKEKPKLTDFPFSNTQEEREYNKLMKMKWENTDD